MAACSLISPVFNSSPTFSLLSRLPNRKQPTFSLSKSPSPSFHKTPNPNPCYPILSRLRHNHKSHQDQKIPLPQLNSSLSKLISAIKPFSPALDSILVLCTSLALSLSLFIADVDSASAFLVTTPRKLQTDELATVRLFQENTPSVVYITNLAAR